MNLDFLNMEDDLLIIYFSGIVILLLGIIFIVLRSFLFKQSIEKVLSRKLKNKEYNEVIRLAQNFVEKKAHRRQHDSLFVMYYLGQSYEALENLTNALKFYTDASVLAVKNKKLHSNILLHMAKIYERMGKNREALSFYVSIAEEDHNGAEALYELARFQYKNKSLKKSREALDKLLKKRPGLLEARFLYGKILYETNQYQPALKQFDLLTKYDYENVEVFFLRAKTMESIRKYNDAVKEYQYILARDWEKVEKGPDINRIRESCQISIVNLFIKLKDYHSGIQFVSTYLGKPASDETKLELMYLYANLLWNTGEEYQALKNFERVYLMKSDYRDAGIMYDRFKKIMPHGYLSNYFTSIEDTGLRGFETQCRKLLGRSNFSLLYRSMDYYIYAKGVFYIIFYRHIEPVAFSKLTDMEVILDSYPVKPQNIEIYSLSGVREDAVTHFLLKSARLIEGDEFLEIMKKIYVRPQTE